jgi:hypothetical protein
MIHLTATPETLTDDQIRKARAGSWIDRPTYEMAMCGDAGAIAAVCRAINEHHRRDWIESVTP